MAEETAGQHLDSYRAWGLVERDMYRRLHEAREYQADYAQRYLQAGGDPKQLEPQHRPDAIRAAIAEAVEAEHVAGLAELGTPPMEYTPPPEPPIRFDPERA